MHAFSRQEQDCVEAALQCHKTCLGMAMTHCLDEGGEHVTPRHFRLMIDCAAICATAADFIMHKSQFHRQLCALCAEVCNACAEDCAKLDGMEECVEACRRCYQACREMA
ncbi:MAG TPA: four-helix bundle copper-binding protein [Rhizomicrobium sp.]